MGFWSRLAMFAATRAAAAGDAVGSELLAAYREWGGTGSGITVNALSALQHTAVMTCVAILSEDVACLPINVMTRLANGGKQRQADHWLQKLLDKPNAWQTRFEWLEMMMAGLVLRSNAYSVIIRNSRGQPTQLVPIHPDRVALYEAPGGEWFFLVTREGLHEMAVLEDLPMMIHSEDVLHIRWLQTWHSLLGSSRVGMMREAIGLGMAQEQQAANFARSGARPGGVLETDRRMSQEAHDRLKKAWSERLGGWRNAGQTVILEEGLKWKSLGMTMVDAEFMKSREYQLEDIARGFRIPHFKLGLKIERGDLVQLNQMYLNDVVSKWCERLAAKFCELGDLDGRETFIEFDYSHFLKADLQSRLTALRTGIVGMVYKPNEARRSEGLPDVEGGDTLYQPTNTAPIGFVPQSKPGSGPGSDLSGEAAPGGMGDPARIPDLPGDGAPPATPTV